MCVPGNHECSWWDEGQGVEVINTAALTEFFMTYIKLPDWDFLSSRHFSKFVEFLRAEFPQWEGLALFLWPDVGGCSHGLTTS